MIGDERAYVAAESGDFFDNARTQERVSILGHHKDGFKAVVEFAVHQCHLEFKFKDSFETIFMMPKDTYTFLSSRIVKEIARLGGDVSTFVPDHVQTALTAKLGLKKL